MYRATLALEALIDFCHFCIGWPVGHMDFIRFRYHFPSAYAGPRIVDSWASRPQLIFHRHLRTSGVLEIPIRLLPRVISFARILLSYHQLNKSSFLCARGVGLKGTIALQRFWGGGNLAFALLFPCRKHCQEDIFRSGCPVT